MEEQKTGNINYPVGIKGIFFLVLILSVFFSYEMGNRNFADPDEGRYVEIPKEMVISGDYVTPKLNGLKYFEKPVLFYWMQSASIKAFGINEISMRLWVVIFAILGCLSVFFIGSKCYSNSVGLISSGILATNILYYAHSRLIILDLVTSVLMSASLWCFYLAFIKENAKKKYIVAMYALSALTCLTKGLIGAVLPGFIALLWIALTKNWAKIKTILYLPGLLVFLAIFLPWHVLVAYRNHDFLHFYFIVEHFLRYTTTMHCRYQPTWFFIPVLLVGFLPWTGFSLVAVKNSIQMSINKNQEHIFFMCWIFGVLGFFSLSGSKLIPYILPISQPIALIIGITINDSINSGNKDFQNGMLMNIILFLIAFVAYFFVKSEISDVLRDVDAALLVNIFFGLFVVLIIVSIGAICSEIGKMAAIILYLFFGANMMWLINKASVYYQEIKKPTTKSFAETINMNKKEGDLVFCYKRYYQDFPVYLNSTVGVVDFVGELEFGANADKKNDILITEDNFWNLWSTTNKRIFLLLSRDHYREVFSFKNFTHKIMDVNKYFIVITNR